MTCIYCKERIKKDDNVVRLSKDDTDYKLHHTCWREFASNRSEEQSHEAIKKLIESFENKE